jgi:hypothetical protein
MTTKKLADGTELTEDENGHVRCRVPLRAMDAAPAAVHIETKPKLVDGLGRPAGHRPGFVYSDGPGLDPSIVERARREYEERITNLWKHGAGRTNAELTPTQAATNCPQPPIPGMVTKPGGEAA